MKLRTFAYPANGTAQPTRPPRVSPWPRRWQNIGPSPDRKVLEFIDANNKWVRLQAVDGATSTAPEDRAYWASVQLVYDQLDGLVAGYNAHRGGLNALTPTQIQLIGMTVELGDIGQAVEPSRRPRFERMSAAELDEWRFAHSHCSAMIKTTADLGELFSSHNTWTGYEDMLRLWKVYAFPFSTAVATTVSFSGYPGKIAGIDDFYVTSERLTVIETTNGVYNTSLFDAVTPQTVPYWARVTVANRNAASAPAWHQIFYRYNSGTYNNQWMTVDYKLFTPHQPLRPNTLVVSEQLPGYFTVADQTMALQRGHWPSYNVPFYSDIYERSGYVDIVRRFGPTSSYQLAHRAPIFRRDADTVGDLDSMRHFMRLNRYNISGLGPGGHGFDPLFATPSSAIAARGDLAPGPALRMGGATDCKITSAAMIGKLQATAVAGPTSVATGDLQPIFSWTGRFADLGQFRHYGHPTYFNFSWQVFGPMP